MKTLPYVVAALLLFGVVNKTAVAVSISDNGQGTFAISGAGATELSGLTYAGGTQYYSVVDSGAGLFDLTIAINSTNGRISTASINSSVTLDGSAGVADLEGVAYDWSDGRVYVSDETGPGIRKYNLSGGDAVSTVTVPTVYDAIRPNFSLESLSRQSDNGALWTANEEALNWDGPLSTTSHGSAVRLQKFDASGSAVGQWAYVTDSISEMSSLYDRERSGVADLLALPGGDILVLERECGGGWPGFRSRIYQVDFDGATDVTKIGDLDVDRDGDIDDETSWTAVSKTLLWGKDFALSNFEGITLGPELDNGDFSLVLVSDDGGGNIFFDPQQDLYSLVIAGVIPEPSTITLLIVAGAGLAGTWLVRRSRVGRGRSSS